MRKRWLLHVIFWIAYVIEDTSLEYAWVIGSMPEMGIKKAALMSLHANLALLPIKLLFTYYLLYVSIDRSLLKNRKLWKIVTELIIVLFLAMVAHRTVVHFYISPYVYLEPEADKVWLEVKRMLSAMLDIGFVAGGAVAMKLLRMYWLGKEREKQLEKEKLESELKFLRTQTNPHFLFNTLNNIYALARKKSDDTADVVMKLSKLLRFMLYESRNERIQVGQEIRMIEDYLELEKIRYNERLVIVFKKEIDNPSEQIAPLLLLPFIENAFKHGASETRFDSFINIELNLKNGILHFSIKNSKDGTGELTVKENIGLSNVRRQLQLIYKDHNLQVQNQHDIFTICLTINLHSDAAI